MILAGSHAVVATQDVTRIVSFFEALFDVKTHFANPEFAEFVFPSGFRLAFFRPVGKSAQYFSVTADRRGSSIGLTVPDVDALYAKLQALPDSGASSSGAPKDHPWGERSFLLIDPDGNRWEIVQTPSKNGMLVPR